MVCDENNKSLEKKHLGLSRGAILPGFRLLFLNCDSGIRKNAMPAPKIIRWLY